MTAYCCGCGDVVPVARDCFGLPKLCGDCAAEMRLMVRELIESVYADELLRYGLAALLDQLTDDDGATP